MTKPYERFTQYMDSLKENGRGLPTNQYGDINFTLIAKECGMRRQWFSENSDKIVSDDGKTLSQVIEYRRNELGVETGNQPKDVSELITKQRDAASKEANQLRKALNLKLSEIEFLKNELELLKQENRILRNKVGEHEEIMDMVASTGRSFHWNI